ESIALREALAGTDLSRPAEELAKLPADARRRAVRHLRDLARGHGYLGDVLLDDRKVHDADRAYWSSHRIREKVEAALGPAAKAADAPAAAADLLDARMQLAGGWSTFPTAQPRQGARGPARHFAQKSLELQRKLVEASPNTVEYRIDLCDTLNRIAGLNL